MKKWLYRITGALGVLLTLGAAVEIWLAHVERKERKESKEIAAWLFSTIIPQCEVHNQTLPEAVAYLMRQIEAQPGHPQGLRIIIASDEESKRASLRKIKPGASGGISSAEVRAVLPSSPSPDLRISVPLETDSSAWLALAYIGIPSDRTFRIQGRKITLYQHSEMRSGRW